MNKVFIGVGLLLISKISFSHIGKLDSKGCHKVSKTGEFHCHQNGSSTGKIVTYKRSLFGKWKDVDNDCINTRHEVLIDRSDVKVKLKDCKVVSGKWDDFYSSNDLKNPKNIDIDHVVPLKHAFDNGASKWSKKMRVKFSNDMENLVVTDTFKNMSKGAQSITSWKPKEKRYACRYIKRWFKVKKKYKLNISKGELKVKSNLDCE